MTTKTDKFETIKANEIKLLSSILDELKDAKKELSNDITRLAMKNLPLMVQDDNTVKSNAIDETNTGASISAIATTEPVLSLSQSTVESSTSHDQDNQLQELEPLDLDL